MTERCGGGHGAARGGPEGRRKRSAAHVVFEAYSCDAAGRGDSHAHAMVVWRRFPADISARPYERVKILGMDYS